MDNESDYASAEKSRQAHLKGFIFGAVAFLLLMLGYNAVVTDHAQPELPLLDNPPLVESVVDEPTEMLEDLEQQVAALGERLEREHEQAEIMNSIVANPTVLIWKFAELQEVDWWGWDTHPGYIAAYGEWLMGDLLGLSTSDFVESMRSGIVNDSNQVRAWYANAQPVLKPLLERVLGKGRVEQLVASAAPVMLSEYDPKVGALMPEWGHHCDGDQEKCSEFLAAFKAHYGFEGDQFSLWMVGFLNRRYEAGGMELVLVWREIFRELIKDLELVNNN